MSSRTPRRRRGGSSAQRSPWIYLAPAALLGAVTVITMILSGTGVLGHTADGGPPPSSPPSGPVQTLSVPQTAPPPEPTPSPPPPPPPKKTKTTKTTASTTASTTATTGTTANASTTAATTASTTSTTTTTDTTTTTAPATGNAGQHVKWTVKTGDTLSSIATQFGTTVRALERLNPSVDPAALQVGQQIVVG